MNPEVPSGTDSCPGSPRVSVADYELPLMASLEPRRVVV